MFSLNKIWIFVIGFLAIIYCLVEAQGEGDLYIYLCAAGKLKTHTDIYNVAYIMGQYRYYYSVFFAILLTPFYSLSYPVVKFFWLLLNVILYFHLFFLLAKSKYVSDLSTKQRKFFLWAVFIFSLRFFHENIHASQITILIFWSAIFGLYLMNKNKIMTGSALLALGINIKLLPVVFIPYLFYRGNFKALFFTGLFLFFFYAIPSVIIGHSYHLSLLTSWLELINPTQKKHVLDVAERSFHSLSTLLSTLLVAEVPDTYAMSLKRNIMDVSLDTLKNVLFCTRIFLAGLTLYFLRTMPFKPPVDNWRKMIEICYILLLIPLLFPHQQHYAFLFIIPSFCILLYFIILHYPVLGKGERQFVTGVLILVYLVSNLKLLLGEFNHYYEHYKILTYGALLLIPLLVWLSSRSSTIPSSNTGKGDFLQ